MNLLELSSLFAAKCELYVFPSLMNILFVIYFVFSLTKSEISLCSSKCTSKSKYFNLKKRVVFNNPFLNLFWRLYQAFFRYGILYLSLLVPNFMYSKKPLIDPAYLKKVSLHFKNDWENCLKYKNRKT